MKPKEKNVTERIDQFVMIEGKGSLRDALNVALARIDQKQNIIDLLQQQLRDVDELDILICPHCRSTDLIGGGTDLFKCMDCQNRFQSCANVNS